MLPLFQLFKVRFPGKQTMKQKYVHTGFLLDWVEGEAETQCTCNRGLSQSYRKLRCLVKFEQPHQLVIGFGLPQRRGITLWPWPMLRECLSCVSLAINKILSAVRRMKGTFAWHTTAMPHHICPLILRVDVDGRLKCKYYVWGYLDFNVKGTQNVCALWDTPSMSFFLLRHKSILRGLSCWLLFKNCF